MVGDLGGFTTNHWGRTPLLRRSGGTFGDVLSVRDVDQLIASSARRPTVRMIRAGRPVDPAEYCTSARLGGRRVDDVVDAMAVGRLLGAGATLVLQSLHRIWPPAARFADSFAAAAGHPVQLNAYLTPPNASGFAEHADDHDVFALQAAGRKRWTVAGLGEIEVGAGDVLYVPAGVRHCAATADRLSLHLTLGVFRRTYRRAVERVLRELPELDRPLPLGYHAPNGPVEGADAAFQDAADALQRVDVSSVMEAEARRAVPVHDRTGTVSAALLADDVGPESVIAWATSTPSAEPLDDGRWRLVMGATRWRVPEAAVHAVVALAARPGGRKVADLDGLDESSCVVLARRLLRAGACRLLEP